MKVSTFIVFAALAMLATCEIATAALPNSPTAATVSVYASFPTRPGRISFDTLDNLYVGNFNEPGPPNVAAVFFRVDATNQAITTCSPIDDPDAIYVDRNGILGTPGSVLVGGWQDGAPIGQIFAVQPNCGSTSLVASGGCLGNINTFAEDALGRLYITNASEYTVCVYDGGSWSEFLPSLGAISRISIYGTDIYISYNDIVRRYDTNGVEQDPLVTTGELVTIGSEGQLIVARTGTLIAVDPVSKIELVILTDVLEGISDAEFDSAGDLYVVQNTTYRILKLESPIPTAVSQSSAGNSFLSVFPNPSSGLTKILYQGSFQSTPVEIYDARGRRVLSFTGYGTEGALRSFSFDAAKLSSGVYFVRAGTGNHRFSQKLLVLR